MVAAGGRVLGLCQHHKSFDFRSPMSRIRTTVVVIIEALVRPSFFLIYSGLLELELGEKALWLIEIKFKYSKTAVKVELARVQRRRTLSAEIRSLTWRDYILIIYVILLFRSPGCSPTCKAENITSILQRRLFSVTFTQKSSGEIPQRTQSTSQSRQWTI